MDNDKKLILKALLFACDKHEGQTRKYTGLPYVTHPWDVAMLVIPTGARAEVVAAALLHDTLEDTNTTYQELVDTFGEDVAKLVLEVTDVSKKSDGNRATRKAIDREHLAKASAEGQTIKLADLIDNTKSIVKFDPDFAKVYLPEKAAVLNVLKNGDKGLAKLAREYIS